MRRVFHSIVLVAVISLSISLWACSKEETNSFVVPTHSILVSHPGETGSTEFEARNISSIEATTIPDGWTVENIDLYNGIITVTAPSTFDNNEDREGDLVLKGYTPTGNTRTVTIYVAVLQNADIDFSDRPANCFVVTQANTRYKFNPYIGGTSTPLETSYVELLWQTRKELINYIDMRDGKVSFYIDGVDSDDDTELSLYPGNALIGAFNDNDELIWSWHIWVTDKNPEAAEYITTLSGRDMMVMNLGAISVNDGSGNESKILASYGLYYQWGRRTPFVGPIAWNFIQNEDARLYDSDGDMLFLDYVESTAETGTEAWANANPMCIIKGNATNSYDWLADTASDALWSDSTKTESDPCPHGWRLPDSSLYANLTITDKDDTMSWEEAQPMYGWTLVDTTSDKEYFFTAAGRRNYLDGRLDNMNTNLELPVPWSGYYWTTTTNGADATALYFNLNTNTRTWNGIDVAHAMHRANALPVRCVRE
ncbi:MAG: hypothetical protein IJ464_03945 [Alistipes sp.]|nr:hypothetical protein [Alistipes sp.]